MNIEKSEKESLLFRTILIFTMIVLTAAVRLAPHPWNFTPIGAIALFSGAMVRDRRIAFFFPLSVMFATDVIIGFNKLSPLVYASFLISVLLGRAVVGLRFTAGHRAKRQAEMYSPNTENLRTLPRITAATFLGSLQFFLITTFDVWAFLGTYPRTA